MLKVTAAALAVLLTGGAAVAQSVTTRYVRYSHEGKVAYGVLEGEAIRELEGDLFAGPRETGRTVPLSAVRLLAPCRPSKVIAVGLNYRSHLGERPAPAEPGLFAKLPSALIGPEDEIVIPVDASNVHYEGELVVVIGKKAKNVSVVDAADYVFGVTAGNDVSERGWQRGDLQWLRAKASDTFAPIGPAIVSGLDYNDLLVQTRLNGELRQSERTRDMLRDVEAIVSYISHYITLLPGDVVEVEIEGIGVLRNTVVAAQSGG